MSLDSIQQQLEKLSKRLRNVEAALGRMEGDLDGTPGSPSAADAAVELAPAVESDAAEAPAASSAQPTGKRRRKRKSTVVGDVLLKRCKLRMEPIGRMTESEWTDVWVRRSVYSCFLHSLHFREALEGSRWDFEVRDQATGEGFVVVETERVGDYICAMEDPEVIARERRELVGEAGGAGRRRKVSGSDEGPRASAELGGEVDVVVLDEGSDVDEGDYSLPPGVMDYFPAGGEG
ncbi:hypothetical protein FOZ63_017576 [Perkinsus olseni]|uniref:Uncharacterized protein n=1 Tax=Perkinsus olseni TaxID=32597 RepID=A0A7J6TAT4_PEROL|nr:hypothetical protein FOZ63_017576 [Perkinsus olseni]KAF4741882.1 hypothetical protein FOZ62_005146 [Perkinsus olseni]